MGQQKQPQGAVKKLRVGWFTFTCCEDNSIVLVELMNQHYFTWKKLIDFRYCRVIKSHNKFDEFDVAFIEGAISNDHDKEKLIEIRKRSKYLVAVGACACGGYPSAQRNDFPEHVKVRIEPFLTKWNLYEKVLKVEEVVKVDDKVDGCPMVEPVFLKTVDKYLKLFGIVQESKPGETEGKHA